MTALLALLPLALLASDEDASVLPRTAALAHMPLATTSAGAAELDGYVYYLGGYTGRPHDYFAEAQAEQFLRFEPRSGRFEQLPGIGRIQGLALVSDGQRLLQVGGLRIRNARGEKQRLESVDEVHAFDPLSEQWTALPALPEPRSSHDAFVVDGTLWVVGGWRLTPDGGEEWHDTFLELDLEAETPTWVEHPQPFERRALAVAAHGDQLLVLGGMDEWGDIFAETLLFDTESRTWSEGPAFPGFGFGVSVAPTRDGYLASGRSGELHAWSTGDAAWRAIGRQWMPRFFHRLVPDGAGGVVVMGGIQTGGRPTLIEHLPAAGASDGLLALDLPSPMATNNRQAAHLAGGRLMFVGGNTGTDQHDFAPERFATESWSLNLADLTWERLADLPAPRQSGKLVAISDGRLAYVGGFAHDGEKARSHSEIFAYDAKQDAWSVSTPLPATRTQYGLGRVGDAVYLLGGLEYDPDAETPFGFPMEILSAAAGDALAFEPSGLEMPEQRRAFASVVHDGRIFVVGGMGEGFSPVESSFVIDPAAGTLTPIASPPNGTRIGARMVVVGERLALVAGTYLGREGSAREIEVYDPASDTWSTSPVRLDFERGHVHAAAFNGALLVASAQEEPGRVHLRLIDLDAVALESVGTLEASY